MPRRLQIVLPVALASVLAFALPSAPRADDPGEELPWWAEADYPEESAAAALREVPDAPQDDDAWWAGGSDAVLVLGAADAGPGFAEDAAGSDDEPEAFWDPAEDSAYLDPDGDDGRNPLYTDDPDGERAEGHRAGEGDPDGDPAGEGTTEALPGEDGLAEEGVAVQENRRREPNQCNRLAKQIVRYEADLELAEEQGNDRAAALLEGQIERKQARWDAKCAPPPGPSALEVALVVTMKAAKLAAKVARLMYGSPF